jgi:SAM-dependent methyltransferase
MDITSESVSRLQDIYPQYHFYQGDISQEKTGPDGEFDIVFAADVLFHIIDDGAFHIALHNLASLLTPNGLLILSDVFPAQTLRTSIHVCHRSLNDYLNCLQSDGLRLLHIEPIFAILQPPPIVPGAARVWRLYSRSWNYALHFARWSLFDGLLADVLGWLDDRLFLPKYGAIAPNSKWLLAEKRHVA